MLEVVILTVQIALLATAINFPVSLIIANYQDKLPSKFKFILDVFISLPLALPPVVTGYFLLVIFSPNGILGNLFFEIFGFDIVFTWFAAALASALVSFPLTVRPMMLSFSNIDSNLINAARSLGANKFQSFYKIKLNLALPGILAGVILGFTRSLGEFGATIMVAGNIPGKTQTLPLAIYTSVQVGDESQVYLLVGLSIGLALMSLSVYNLILYRYKNSNKDI